MEDGPEELRPKKTCQVRLNVKVLLTIFFDHNGVVHHEFLSQGRKVNKEYYLEVMHRLCEAIRQKCTELWKTNHEFCTMMHERNPATTTFFFYRTLSPLTFSSSQN